MELEGTRIGPYLLGVRIGAGGMGQVYEAHDTRLGRRVAIKVLPADAGLSVESSERFDREGRTIAGLNHPNICVLHDVGQATIGGPAQQTTVRYLVMELLEGETLAARLSKGPIPLIESLRIAAAIAAALDKAHRAGVVHRDIKPGNVMITKSGVKVLDFGIAKTTMRGGADDLTMTGAVIGTVAYMSPEQRAGADVDHRSDVYALGIVLFEMLTGARPDKDLSLPAVPPAVERCSLKCLVDDRDERWQTAADLKSELEWLALNPAPAATPRSSFSVARLGWAAALVAVVAAAAMLGLPRRSDPDTSPRHLNVELPGSIARLSALALTPDGSSLAYVAAERAASVLRVRNLRTGTTTELASGPQRGGGFAPFFSPDGEWIAFVNRGKLSKVRTTGGAPVEICDVVAIEGASWSNDDHLVYSSTGRLWRVHASGGAPQEVAVLEPGETAVYPQVLPGGETVLVTILGANGVADDGWLESVSIRDGARRKLVKGAISAVTVGGYIVFSRGSDLLAMPFDTEQVTVSGSPTTVLRGVHVWGRVAKAQFTVADDGTLVYFPLVEGGNTIVRVSNSGGTEILPLPPRRYAHLKLMPDERSMILEIEAAPHQLYRYDFTNQALTQLTFEGANHRAVLSPDGQTMIYSSDRTVPRSLFRQATNGSGGAEALTRAEHLQNASAWSPDGRWLVFTENRADTRSDVLVMSLPDRNVRPFASTRFQEQAGTLSPDGRWLAYASDESGKLEVILAGFPGPGPRTQVSTEGGDMPWFSKDGRQLYFRLNDQVFVVDLTYQPALSPSRPRLAFDIPNAEETQTMPFPITSAGDAIYYARAVRDGNSASVIINWLTELQAAVGPR